MISNHFIKKLRWPLGSSLIIGAFVVGLSGMLSPNAYSDNDHDREDDDDKAYTQQINRAQYQPGHPDYEAVTLYRSECSACHIAYPAGLLPASGWKQVMAGLSDHFGDDASLDADTTQMLTRYLTDNASDSEQAGRFSRFARGVDAGTPLLRITELPYFKRKHDEVDAVRMVRNNPDVGSFSQCQACHGKAAERGVFDEDTVDIPNFGRWDD